MARIYTTHIEGGLYYITSRGDNHKDIFKEKDDYMMYIDLLKKYKQQYDFKLFSFVLLASHLHLLIELREGITISDITRDLNGNYTKYFNAKFQRKGHLFQERYKMTLVEKDSLLLPVSAYMHLNPKVLGITSDARDYPYSSYQAYRYYSTANKADASSGYMGLELKDEIMQALNQLSGVTYENFLQAITGQEIDEIGRNLRKSAILGSEDFTQRVKAEALAQKKQTHSVDRMPARVIVFAATIALVFSITTVYLLNARQKIRQDIKQANTLEIIDDKGGLSQVLSRERQALRKELEEKYHADMVSSKALSKRLSQIERERAENLKNAEGQD